MIQPLFLDSRDDAEGPLLPEDQLDLTSFQPTDSDVPSFLEDCNRVSNSSTIRF